MTLASASERIRGMEETLGVPLLLREHRGVQATPAGRTLAHHARLVLAQMDRMRGELDHYGQGLKGHVRVLCNTTALSEYLPQVLGEFLKDQDVYKRQVKSWSGRDSSTATCSGNTCSP